MESDKSWSAAVQFLLTKPDKCAKATWKATEIELPDESEQTIQLLELPNQFPTVFQVVVHHAPDGEIDRTATSQLFGGVPTQYFRELVFAPIVSPTGNRSPLLSAITSGIRDGCGWWMPAGIHQLMRDYAMEGLLAEECIDLLVLSVRIFVGQDTWKLSVVS